MLIIICQKIMAEYLALFKYMIAFHSDYISISVYSFLYYHSFSFVFFSSFLYYLPFSSFFVLFLFFKGYLFHFFSSFLANLIISIIFFIYFAFVFIFCLSLTPSLLSPCTSQWDISNFLNVTISSYYQLSQCHHQNIPWNYSLRLFLRITVSILTFP